MPSQLVLTRLLPEVDISWWPPVFEITLVFCICFSFASVSYALCFLVFVCLSALFFGWRLRHHFLNWILCWTVMFVWNYLAVPWRSTGLGRVGDCPTRQTNTVAPGGHSSDQLGIEMQTAIVRYTTTVHGQNIQTLQHALCWTPAPPNLNVSARMLAKVMLGVWFFFRPLHGANVLQVTLTLNFGCEGVVPDRRGLNISSIYGSMTAQGGGGSIGNL